MQILFPTDCASETNRNAPVLNKNIGFVFSLFEPPGSKLISRYAFAMVMYYCYITSSPKLSHTYISYKTKMSRAVRFIMSTTIAGYPHFSLHMIVCLIGAIVIKTEFDDFMTQVFIPQILPILIKYTRPMIT